MIPLDAFTHNRDDMLRKAKLHSMEASMEAMGWK